MGWMHTPKKIILFTIKDLIFFFVQKKDLIFFAVMSHGRMNPRCTRNMFVSSGNEILLLMVKDLKLKQVVELFLNQTVRVHPFHITVLTHTSCSCVPPAYTTFKDTPNRNNNQH
jgi:hypothetical protein